MNHNHNKVLWLTRTAVMMALLIALQALTKPLGQLVTGSCVNAVLVVTVLVAGMSGGVTVALLSPIFAWLLGIAPQIVTVPAIMAGNAAYVVLLGLLLAGNEKDFPRQISALATAATAKFVVLHLLVRYVICGLLADVLLAQGVLKAPMLQALPAIFSWPQLITALIGGAVALLIVPVVKKAIQK
jgi:hypothetical protein